MMDSRTQRKHYRFCRHRRGYTLVWFAFTLFVVMGIAALVIDLGLARLTQRQMQTAVQSAALEGITFRDSTDLQSFSGHDDATDASRRQAAADLVAFQFDDDFDVAADSRNFGAGPRVTMTGGVALSSEFNGAQDLSIPNPPVYKPRMQLNSGNNANGDLVAGNASPSPFTVDAEGNAMIARLRRTEETIASGVGASGGTVPYLFGRGTLLHPDLRGRGIAVRAESTADARPAVRVGISQTVAGTLLPGAISFGITRETWESLPRNTQTLTPVSSTTAGGLVVTPTAIGQTANLQNSALSSATGYCPIVATINGSQVVIGFGWAELGAFDGSDVTITKLVDPDSTSGSVAPRNATARLSEVWSNIPAAIRTEVVAANRSFADPLRAPLLVD